MNSFFLGFEKRAYVPNSDDYLKLWARSPSQRPSQTEESVKREHINRTRLGGSVMGLLPGALVGSAGGLKGSMIGAAAGGLFGGAAGDIYGRSTAQKSYDDGEAARIRTQEQLDRISKLSPEKRKQLATTFSKIDSKSKIYGGSEAVDRLKERAYQRAIKHLT